MKKIILMIIPLLLLTGCWNYNELNNIAIATGIAIDKIDNQYEITYLISNAKKTEVSAKEGEPGITTYSGIGDTIQEAMNDVKLKMPFTPYNGHIVVTIISDKIAQEGITDVLDIAARDTESRDFFYLLLSKDIEAKKVLEIISPLETMPSQTLASDVETLNKTSSLIYKITYNDFMYTLLEEGKNPILNSVTILGNIEEGNDEKNLTKTTPESTIKIDTIGIFKKDKLLGWTDNDENEAINILNNKTDGIYIKTKCEDNYIISYIKGLKTKTKIDIDNNKVKVDITGDGTILEANCNIDLKDPKVTEELEANIKKRMEEIINKGTNLVQKELNSDVLGYGMLVHKKNPKKWKEIKNNWDEIFKNLEIEPNIKINIKSKGSLIQTIKEANNEK